MATPRFITADEVRTASGITTKFISDADMNTLIYDQEYEVERILNTTFTPKRVVEKSEGDTSNRIRLQRNPIMRVRAMTVDETTITMDAIRIDQEAGIVWLTGDAETTTLSNKTSERNLVRVDYEYALLEETTTQTETTNDETAGTSVTIEVSDSSDFAEDDYVEITGMDSRYEVAKITSVPGGTSIIVNRLVQTHESGSLVTKFDVPQIGKRFMLIATSLACVARVVGQSFDEITGYSLGDMRIQRGEPYTQWRETALQLRREYDTLLKAFPTRTAIY